MSASPPAPSCRWQLSGFADLSPHALQRIHIARQQVFVVEQQCAFQDADAADEAASHLVCWDAGDAVLAYARLLAPGAKYPEASIGRVITTAAARGRGLGRELVQRSIAAVHALHPGAGIRISAQQRLQAFYAGFGFEPVSAAYLEDGIWHVDMLLAAGPARA